MARKVAGRSPRERAALMLLGATVPAVAMLSACATVRQPPVAAAFADADSVAVTAVVPGVSYTFIRDTRGPWAIHVLEIDADRCVPVLEARKPGPDLHARATTSEIGAEAVAAINADFFILPRGTPVGAHVTRGITLTGPTDRPVFAAMSNAARAWRIGTGRIEGFATARIDSAAIVQVNRVAGATSAYRGTHDGLTLYTSWIGDTVPADSAAHRVTLRLLDGDERAGRAVVLAADSPATATLTRTGAAILLAHGSARDWARRRAAGDTVAWTARVVVGDAAQESAYEVVGGFPQLLRDGRSVLDQQVVAPGFGAGRHPRTAIGWTPAGRLLFVVVDGRQPDWSDGMSLDELIWVFRRAGASDALNLDGGGSTAMVLNGRVVNRPSDREGERAVGNALALTACRGAGWRRE